MYHSIGDIIMKEIANAKINLTLNIVEKRPDGYHNVDMIMQTLDFGDVVTVERIFSSIELSGTGKLAYDETNLAYKAARLFYDVTGIRGGCRIYIEKNIPMCAGMAGGSADAAAVLRALNSLYGKPLGKKTLVRISARLGADVPYCILKGTARAQGIGDVITPLKPFGKVKVLVVKPNASVSTPKAYATLRYDIMAHPDTELACTYINEGKRHMVYPVMGNSFEASVFEQYPEIALVKNRLCELGADGALMSGSGSTVFGIFEDASVAEKAYNEFKDKYNEVYLCSTTCE